MVSSIKTRVGELLSASLALAFSISLFTNSEQVLTKVMYDVGAMPQWAILSIMCAVITWLSALLKTEVLARTARFVSGALWGSVIFIYVSSGVYSAIFWTAVVLFIFDVYLASGKGRVKWIERAS